jgi:cytosolic carboxypeptidase protein 2/3
MLNPDGVRYGNYRCDLFGYDLNRKWKNPVEGVHTPILAVRSLIEGLRDLKYPVYMFCDIHGHSKKNDIFMYGNNFKEDSCNAELGGFEYLS